MPGRLVLILCRERAKGFQSLSSELRKALAWRRCSARQVFVELAMNERLSARHQQPSGL